MANRKIQVEIVGDSSSLEKAFGRAQSESQRAFGVVGKVALAGGSAIAGGLGLAIHAAGQYEASLNVLESVSGATGEQMKGMSELAKQLGADTKLPGTSAKDAADAMVQMSKAGLDVKQTMSGVRSVLVLSAAAGIENARAAEIATNAMNAFKLEGKDLTMVTDLLANAANASSIEIEDAANSMKMAGAVFAGIQGPAVGSKNALIDLTTATALLGNAGIKGSDAGMSLKQMLLQLTGPSEKSKDAMRALYLAALDAGAGQEQLTEAVRGGSKARNQAIEELEKGAGATGKLGDIAFDAAGKMRSLPEIIDLVSKGTKNMTQEQKAAYITQIFGADATRAVIALMNAQAKGWDDMHDKVTKAGAAQDLAAAKMKGFQGSMDAFKSTLETLAITFGSMLLPVATDAMQVFAQMANVLGEHETATMAVVAVLGALAGVVVTAVAALKIYALYQSVATVATAAWTAAQWLLNAALTANPIGLVIVGLVALGVALVIAYKKSETFREIVNAAFGAVKAAAQALADFVTVTIPAAFENVLAWVRSHWPEIAALVSGPFFPLVALATDAFGIRSALVGAFVKVKDAVSGLIGDVVALWKAMPGAVADAIALGADKVKNAVLGLFKHLPGFVKDALGISSPSKVFMEIGENIVAGVIRGIESKADALRDAAMGAFGGLFGRGGGEASTSGLVAQVTNALSYARSHGWGGSVTSGFRTYAEQAQLYARYLAGGPLAAKPGTSSHEFGQAVDVTDYGTFGAIMAGAPAGSRLYNFLGAADPVHYSVSGYDQGGWLMPGLTLAENRTGRPERVLPPGASRGGGDIHIHVGTVIGTSLDEAAEEIYAALLRKQSRNTGLRFA